MNDLLELSIYALIGVMALAAVLVLANFAGLVVTSTKGALKKKHTKTEKPKKSKHHA